MKNIIILVLAFLLLSVTKPESTIHRDKVIKKIEKQFSDERDGDNWLQRKLLNVGSNIGLSIVEFEVRDFLVCNIGFINHDGNSNTKKEIYSLGILGAVFMRDIEEIME